MGSREAPTNGLELPRLNPTPEPEFLQSVHYMKWVQNLKRAVRRREPWIKFLFNLLTYVGETVSLVLTLVLPSEDEYPYASWIAILLYIVTWGICAVVSVRNKKKTRRQVDQCYTVKEILFIVFMPARYCKVFSVRDEKLRVIQQENTGSIENIRITEDGLQALVDINAQDLEDQRINLFECFFQSIPTMLLQSVFLFQARDSFSLCTAQDLSRLLTIMFALGNVAKAACSFETGSYDYQASLHFSGFYKSRGSHPMRVYSKGLISWTKVFRFLSHCSTAVSRFYATAFFMAAHWSLGLIYLTTLLCLNITVLQLFPQNLLDQFCNAPLGIHSCVSYIADRWINLFCNVGTRFNNYSNRPKPFGFFRARVPLQSLQIIHFIVPFCFTLLLGGAYRKELLKSVSSNGTISDNYVSSNGTISDNYVSSNAIIGDKNLSFNSTISAVLSGCPQLSEGYNLSPTISKRLAELLYPFYRELDGHLATFNDVFLQLHFVWLFFGCQLVLSIVYGYSDLLRRKVDPEGQQDVDLEDGYLNEVYPILTAYGFWGSLFNKALIQDQFSTRIKRVRMLMALTVFQHDQFYEVVNVFYVFPRCSLSDEFLQQQIAKYTSSCTDSDEELDTRAKQYKEREHHFRSEFRRIHSLICDPENYQQKADDIKLFVMFISTFDRKMYGLTSYRVERVRHYF